MPRSRLARSHARMLGGTSRSCATGDLARRTSAGALCELETLALRTVLARAAYAAFERTRQLDAAADGVADAKR